MGKKRPKPRAALAEDIRRQLDARYPTLHVYERPNEVLVKGTFPILSDDSVLDRYSVEIYVRRDKSDAWPAVRETGGRIPKTADYHISSDGTACLFVEDEAYYQFPNGLSFVEFLEIPVRNFFLSQSIVANGGDWPLGYRSHGTEGVIEFYMEKLNTEDPVELLKCLKCLSIESVKGHHPCPCESGEIYRRCHQARLSAIRPRIKPTFAARILNRIAEAVRSNNRQPNQGGASNTENDPRS